MHAPKKVSGNTIHVTEINMMLTSCRTVLFILSLVFSSLNSFSQKTATLQGTALSRDQQKPLERATVTVTRKKDSVRLKTALTRNDGLFTFTNLPFYDSLLVEISFVGYESFVGLLILTQKHFIMQPVELVPAAETQQQVIVAIERPVMIIKPDTIEFRTNAFKMAPNALAEDLMKRIPGLFIDQNGKLFFNGRPVTSILVDGKPFFGTDGIMALKNIPVDMIDKIQFSDTKSSEEELLNLPAKNQDATLNIKLKNGNKYFGQTGAAAGTDGRYSASAFANSERGKDRLSLVGSVDNINSPAKGVIVLTQGGGIARTVSTGLNYSHQLSDKNYLNVSYQFTQANTYRENVVTSEQNILQNQFLLTNSFAGYINQTTDHDVKINLERMRGLSFQLEFERQFVDNSAQSTQQTRIQNSQSLNSLSSVYHSVGNSTKWNGQISYTKLFGRGRLLSTSLHFALNDQTADDRNLATLNFYQLNRLDSQLRQQILQSNLDRSMGLSFFYGNPLGKYARFQLKGDLMVGSGHATRTTWNLDSNYNKTNIDSLYSNDFKSRFVTAKGNTAMGFSFNKKKITIQIDEGIFGQSLQNLNVTKQNTLNYHWVNFFPEGSFSYNSPEEQFILSALSNYILPTIQQLQPVADNSNPILIKLGNPNLKPADNYIINLQYRKLVAARHNLSYAGELSFNPIMDRITSAVTYDSSGRQLQQYVNINGTYSVKSSFYTSINFKKGSSSFLINLNGDFIHVRDKQYLNGSLAELQQNTLSPAITLNYSRADIIAANLIYYVDWNKLNYDQNRMKGNNYTTQNVRGILDLYLFKRIKYQNSLFYQYNSGMPANLQRSSMLWNMDISVLCLKNKAGEIRFTAFDLLKENRNLSRTITATSITDSQSNNLQQYFLIGFRYHFGKLEKQANNH